MPTEKNLSNLIINKVESKAVYDYMTANNLVNEDELYFISGDDEVQIVVDSELNATSENPVQNKIVTAAINNLNTLVGDTSVSTQIDTAIASKADASDLNAHTGNSNIHITSTERTNWNAAKTHADSAHAPSNAEENQNAFSNIIVGGTTIVADTKTDTLTIVAGNNVTLTPDATNDKLTIAAKDTVYTHPTYTSKSSGLYKVTVDGTGHVSAATAVAKSDITALGIPAQDTTYSTATQSANGLMSSSDKIKLDGIETGANKTVVDSALSSTSTNPVQNKAVNTAISNLNTLVGDKSVASQITSAIDALNLDGTYIAATQKGAVNGVAELDSNGKVPSTQLPSYVDDVLEYNAKSGFPSTGETGKIYVDTATNLTYRWSGSAYVEISPSIALGTTSSTAFRGDYGNTAYTHATAKGSAFASGLYKITTNDQGHVTAATAVAKSDITGLGIPGQDTTYSAATTSAAGLMSAADKSKLDGIATGATKITVDSALSSTSTNPVQNKVVNTAISSLNELVGDTPVADQITSAVNNAGVLTIDLTDADAGIVPYTNADLLGGKFPSEYASASELNQLKDDIDNMSSEFVKAGHVLTVGSGCRFKTINAAIAHARTICSEENRVLIKIMPGVYEEEIILNPNPGIDFEGVDWANTMIRYPSVYPNAPVFTCGQGTFKNLTLYSNCPDGEESPSYGVHIEYQNVPDAVGMTQFDHCWLQSRLSAAVGAGLGANSGVYMNGCVCVSEMANAVYVHGYPESNVPGQTFTAYQCDFRALSGGVALHVDDVNGVYGLTGSELTVECVGCRGSKMALRTATDTFQGFVPNSGDVRLSPYSKGNEFVGANYTDLYNEVYVACMRAVNGLLFIPWQNASAFAIMISSVLDSSGSDVTSTVSLHSAHRNGFLLTTTMTGTGPYWVQAVVYPA